jgi:hypothetical protein
VRHSLRILAVWSALLTPGAACASPVGDLQHLLDNAGFNTGGETGKWTPGTASALADFAKQYDIDAISSGAPDDSTLATLIATAQQKLEADYAAFPTASLPEDYFVGVGDANWFVINTWAKRATIERDGKKQLVPIERYYEWLDQDVSLFKAARARVIRSQLGMDGALHFDECRYRESDTNQALDACYTEAYATAAANKWAKQIELLNHIGDNPVVKLYVDSVEEWNRAGFHVIFVPTDFFNGAGSSFDGSDNPKADSTPLFHRALMRDLVFRDFFPKFVAAVLAEFRKRNITNVSLQSANEPRFCNGRGRPAAGELAKWQAVERAEFDAARRIAPRLALISTATCTASVSFFDGGQRYTDLGTVMPWHKGLDGVTYALHLYTPGAIFGAGAANDRFKDGTAIRYPYQALSPKAAANEGARFIISNYNEVKPGPKFFARIFGDMAAFAKARGVRVIITETGIPKPDYGIPREDRVAVLRDLIAASRENGVPFFYFQIVGKWGLSSCPDSVSVPDHRLDPAMVNLIAWGNGVVSADPMAPLEPLEVRCGHPVRFQTLEGYNSGATDVSFNSILRTRIKGARGGEDALDFSVRGTFFDGKVGTFEVEINTPMTEAEAKALKDACPSAKIDKTYDDGKPRLRQAFSVVDGELQARAGSCHIANAPKPVATQLRIVLTEFGEIASDMVTSGDISSITTPALRKVIERLADGTLTIAIQPPT